MESKEKEKKEKKVKFFKKDAVNYKYIPVSVFE